MVQRSRRSALRALGAALAGLAGCQGRDRDAETTTTATRTTTTATVETTPTEDTTTETTTDESPETHDAVQWHARVGPMLENAPTVHDGTVYVNGGRLVALDAADGREQWAYSTGVPDWDASHAQPMVADGRVYAALGARDHDLVVAAVRAADGEQAWQFAPPDFYGQVRSAGATSDTVYIGSMGGTEAGEDVYALDADSGHQRWHRDLAGTCTGGAATAGDVVVLETRDGVYALDAASGETAWHLDYTSYRCSPMTRAETVYTDDFGRIAALDARDGSVEWEVADDVPAAGNWTLVDGRIYAAGDGSAFALDPDTGAVVWRAKTPAGRPRSVVVPGNSRMYVGIQGGTVVALDARSGGTAWQADRDPRHLAVTPGGDTVFVTTDDWHSLTALDATDGTRRWRVAFEEQMVAPPVVDEETAFVGTDDRVMYALGGN
jgi:outer membrane protein assembly factor BamB